MSTRVFTLRLSTGRVTSRPSGCMMLQWVVLDFSDCSPHPPSSSLLTPFSLWALLQSKTLPSAQNALPLDLCFSLAFKPQLKGHYLKKVFLPIPAEENLTCHPLMPCHPWEKQYQQYQYPAVSVNKGCQNHQQLNWWTLRTLREEKNTFHLAAIPCSLRWTLRKLKMWKCRILVPDICGAYQRNSFSEFRLLHLPIHSAVSHSVMSDSLRPHGLQQARRPCPSPTPRVYSNSCPSSRWCQPTISFSVMPFSSCLQSFPASGSFPMNQFFALTHLIHVLHRYLSDSAKPWAYKASKDLSLAINNSERRKWYTSKQTKPISPHMIAVKRMKQGVALKNIHNLKVENYILFGGHF